MESSMRTEEIELASEPASIDVASTEIHPVMAAAVRERCAVCGAAMAADQRYCVECGERRGAPRVTLLEGPARRTREQSPPSMPAPRQRGGLVNSTLIAIIGMLLLAMGIGVLIGRSNNNANIKSSPPQVVTVSVAGTPATGATAAQPTTSTGTTPTSTTPSTTPKAKSKAAAKPTATTPAPKAVKVGTPGHGRGYQNGHFTGDFFGE